MSVRPNSTESLCLDQERPCGDAKRETASKSDALSKSGAEFLWVAVPKLLSAVLQLAINLLVQRQLGPELSGIVFVCITGILLCDAVLGSALDVAVLRLATGHLARAEALQVQKAAVILKLWGCVLLGVPIVASSPGLSRLLFHNQENASLLPLSVGALFSLLLLRSVQTRFQVSRSFRWYGAVDLLHSCVKFGGIGLLLGLHAVTPFAVLGLYMAGPLLVSLVMLCTASRDMLLAPVSKPAVWRLLTLFRWYAGAAIAGSVTSRMDIFLVATFAGSRQAGLFSAAQNFTLPFQLLGMYLGVVFAPRIMPLLEQRRLLRLYGKVQLALRVASGAIYLLALAGTSAISGRLLPASFGDIAVLVLLLLPASLMALLSFPLTVSILMFSHPRFLMLLDTCAVAVLGLLYWQCALGYGAMGAAAVTSAFAVFKTALMQRLVTATLKKHEREGEFRLPLSEPSLVW